MCNHIGCLLGLLVGLIRLYVGRVMAAQYLDGSAAFRLDSFVHLPTYNNGMIITFSMSYDVHGFRCTIRLATSRMWRIAAFLDLLELSL